MKIKFKNIVEMKRIFLAVALVVVMFGVAHACSSSGAILTLNQNVSCSGDLIVAYVSGISSCAGKQVNARLIDNAGNIISNTKCDDASDNLAGCLIRMGTPSAPIAPGIYRIQIIFNDSTTPTIFTISTTTRVNATYRSGACYDKNGVYYYCENNCTDQQPGRLWETVTPVSMPLHFAFAMKNNDGTLPSNTPIPVCDYNNPRRTYGLIDYGISCVEFVDCTCPACTTPDCVTETPISRWMFGSGVLPYYRCNISKSCDAAEAYYQLVPPSCTECRYDTHQIQRYNYSWSYQFDMAAFIYDPTYFVPMQIGYNQSSETSKGSAISGSCTGEHLCYTEVPLCGDGICDVAGGERCWNCPQDCGKIADTAFEGSCGTAGCSLCPITPGFSDVRSCIIQKRTKGEDCNCDLDMCVPGLRCNYEMLNGTVMNMGKCCHDNPKEFWNGTHCVVRRGLSVENIKFEFIEKTASSNWVTYQCCGLSRVGSTGWLKLDFDVQNKGVVEELYKVDIYMAKEDIPINFLDPHYISSVPSTSYTQLNTARTGSGALNSHTLKLACVIKHGSLCKDTGVGGINLAGYIDSTGVYNFNPNSPHNTNPLIIINISLQNSADYNKRYHKELYPSPIVIESLTCSGSPAGGNQFYCSNGIETFPATIKGAPIIGGTVSGLCGGWQTPEQVFSIYNGWVPAVSLGTMCFSVTPDTFCVPTPFPPFLSPACFVNCKFEGGCSQGLLGPFI